MDSDPGRRTRSTGSVEQAEQPMEFPARGGVAWLDGDGALELADRVVDLVLSHVDARQVEIRIVTGLVAPRALGALEPIDRFLLAPQGDQVGADVVIRVAEVRIDRDRHLALGDRFRVAVEVGQRPAEKGVSLRGGVQFDGAAIERDGLFQPAGHLSLVGPLEVALGFFAYLVRHGASMRQLAASTWAITTASIERAETGSSTARSSAMGALQDVNHGRSLHHSTPTGGRVRQVAAGRRDARAETAGCGILGAMQSGVRLAAVLLLAAFVGGCAGRLVTAPVTFRNVTPDRAEDIAATLIRPPGDGPF